MNLSSGEMILTAFIALFYGSVISVILISFWKIHLNSKEIQEIKSILLDIRTSLGSSKQ